MQRARRSRRVVKWGLFVCAAVAAFLAIPSWWWVAAWGTSEVSRLSQATVVNGLLTVRWDFEPVDIEGVLPMPGICLWKQERDLVFQRDVFWSPHAGCTWPTVWFELPLWIPFVVSVSGYLVLARADRKAAKLAKVGMCASCGYNRAGLAAGAACPECGAAERTTERA